MFDSLQGKSVIVTRPIEQSEVFATELEKLGAKVINLPVIKVVPSKEQQTIEEEISKLSTYDWVVFTSANGVRFFCEKLIKSQDLNNLKNCKIAAIGPATSEALERQVRKPDLIPSEFVSDVMAEAMGEVAGKRILLARAVQARKVLAEDLKSKGAIVTELPLYDVEINRDSSLDELISKISKPDFVTFTSSSTVHGFNELATRNSKDWLRTVPAICIGPITAKTLSDYGVSPYRVATVYTVQGILDSLVN